MNDVEPLVLAEPGENGGASKLADVVRKLLIELDALVNSIVLFDLSLKAAKEGHRCQREHQEGDRIELFEDVRFEDLRIDLREVSLS